MFATAGIVDGGNISANLDPLPDAIAGIEDAIVQRKRRHRGRLHPVQR